MSTFFHGARATILTNDTFSMTQAASGVVFAVGTAPVNQVGAYKDIVMASSYDEAKEQLGYSDDWEKFTLCEVMYTHFKKYGVGPVFLVNVADPSSSKTTVEAKNVAVVDTVAEIEETAIADSIVVADAEGNAMTAGTDYEVYYEDGKCCIAAIRGGAMDALSEVAVSYDNFSVDTAALEDAVVGGYDADTGVSTGLELVNDVFANYGVNPDIIIAPGFSHLESVATAMTMKTTVNTVFRAMAILDADMESGVTHTDVVKWKNERAMKDPTQILCWPMCKDDAHIYHLSTHAAAIMACTDNMNDDCPSESPSNKDSLKVMAMCKADGSEVKINLDKANYLNAAGILTGLRFMSGFTLWGNYTCAYPTSSHQEEYFINVRRMFNWVGNSLILSYWQFIDSKLTRRLCETVADNANKWINSLTAANHLYGGRVEFNQAENPDEDIAAGIIRPHVYLAPVSPAQEINFLMEYDISYVSTVLGAA